MLWYKKRKGCPCNVAEVWRCPKCGCWDFVQLDDHPPNPVTRKRNIPLPIAPTHALSCVFSMPPANPSPLVVFCTALGQRIPDARGAVHEPYALLRPPSRPGGHLGRLIRLLVVRLPPAHRDVGISGECAIWHACFHS